MVTPARKISEGIYGIDSFNGGGSYIVNLTGAKATCSCPHYSNRLAGTDKVCKHIAAVTAQAERIELIEKARRCSDAQIVALLPKYADDPYVSGALRLVRAERREDRKLREIFS